MRERFRPLRDVREGATSATRSGSGERDRNSRFLRDTATARPRAAPALHLLRHPERSPAKPPLPAPRKPLAGSDHRTLFPLRMKKDASYFRHFIFYCTSKYKKETFSAVTPAPLSITASPCSSQLLRGRDHRRRVSSAHGGAAALTGQERHLVQENKALRNSPHSPSVPVPAGHGAYGNMGFIPHTQPWGISLMFPMLWAPLSHPGPQQTPSDFQTAPSATAAPGAPSPHAPLNPTRPAP